eukprot:822746-Prymnesium_polylepis.1
MVAQLGGRGDRRGGEYEDVPRAEDGERVGGSAGRGGGAEAGLEMEQGTEAEVDVSMKIRDDDNVLLFGGFVEDTLSRFRRVNEKNSFFGRAADQFCEVERLPDGIFGNVHPQDPPRLRRRRRQGSWTVSR